MFVVWVRTPSKQLVVHQERGFVRVYGLLYIGPVGRLRHEVEADAQAALVEVHNIPKSPLPVVHAQLRSSRSDLVQLSYSQAAIAAAKLLQGMMQPVSRLQRIAQHLRPGWPNVAGSSRLARL